MSVRQGNNVIAGHTITDAGFISAFAGSTAPAGWLVCDGSAISRTDYADLFAAISTTYGTGDGSTTFNLPDLSGKLPLYDSAATLGDTTNGKAPNITGEFVSPVPIGWPNGAYGTGALYAASPAKRRNVGQSSNSYDNTKNIAINANLSSAVYDSNATGITPAGVYTLWCIKY